MRYYPAAVKYQLSRLSCLTPEYILGLTTQPPNSLNTTSSSSYTFQQYNSKRLDDVAVFSAYVKYFRFQQNMIVDWTTLPELVFSDIMMMIGLRSLEGLHRCRQVCKMWNEMILRNIWESQSNKNIMKERIERSRGPGMFPSDEEISHAKWLGKIMAV